MTLSYLSDTVKWKSAIKWIKMINHVFGGAIPNQATFYYCSLNNVVDSVCYTSSADDLVSVSTRCPNGKFLWTKEFSMPY